MVYCFACDSCGRKEDRFLRVVQLADPTNYPHCPEHGAMRRDFRAEHSGELAGGLAEWTRNKSSVFPYRDENLASDATGGEAPVVHSQEHRRELMRAAHLHDREPSDNARYRARQRYKRFY